MPSFITCLNNFIIKIGLKNPGSPCALFSFEIVSHSITYIWEILF